MAVMMMAMMVPAAAMTFLAVAPLRALACSLAWPTGAAGPVRSASAALPAAFMSPTWARRAGTGSVGAASAGSGATRGRRGLRPCAAEEAGEGKGQQES